MKVDDNWCEEALDLLPRGNYLVASLNKKYLHGELKKFDFISSCTTGTDHIENKRIPLISLKGEIDFLKDIYATAEHTWALMLSLLRHVPFAFDDVKRGHWDRDSWQGNELHGKTLGIVGFGRVGKQVSRFAISFGMNVIFCDPYIKKNTENIYLNDNDSETLMDDANKQEMDFILKNSDIITVHVPLDIDTERLFGKREFSRMKPSALFINTSRGAVVDENSLIDAILNKKIAGAALDVIEKEPGIVPWKTILDHNPGLNLIITPHIAGNTVESRKKTQMFIANKIREYIKNKERE